MTRMGEIEHRLDILEEKTDAVIALLNDFIELIYEPGYVKKLDKLARYGKREKESREG